ncbi:restriction endonuclease [Streptomyces sp. NPDC058741]|uniref:restriction endonuclease n=1 Tax=Streptomyces sp. NPDC058741 TaxID=3346620 RepID=UPI0036A096E0
MIDERALLESQTLRSSVLERTDVLDKVKTLSLLPDGLHVTTAMVAAYFEVGLEAVKSLVKDHRTELEASGYHLLTGEELRFFKNLSGTQSRTRSLALFPRRAVLNVAMLLRDSEVARQVRVYLLDMEHLARTQPVDNPSSREDGTSLDHRIDRRISHILGKSVLPLFNALIESSGEQRRELVELRADIENVERRLCLHHRRLSAVEGGTSTGRAAVTLPTMTWQALERHVAGLLSRDGCTEVVIRRVRDDRGVDVTARTADGRCVAVRCASRAGRAFLPGADMRKFTGAVRTVDRVDVALFVTTCAFSREAQAIAGLTGVVPVDRAALQTWSAGERLDALR